MALPGTDAQFEDGRQGVPLFACVHAWEMLLSAWDRVESNDGAPGVDRVTLSEFELRLEEHLKELQRDLRERIYQPQPLLRAFRPKPSGGLRPLAIATVRDRVAQTAVALVITPIVDREFEPVSFGYRRGHSVAQAVTEVEKCYEAGYRWIVDADIDNFFDEVDHDALLARLAGSVHDADIVRLVTAWIKAPIQHENETVQPVRGLPQGLPISPVLANLYLDEFDKALLERGLKLVRFADNFLILCKERPMAEAALELSQTVLRDLHLALDPDKTRVTSFDQGFRYLGHLFVRSLVLPSPNRLQKRAPAGAPARKQSQGHPAPSLGDYSACPRASLAAGPACVPDTAMSRALNQALQAAGMADVAGVAPAASLPPAAPPSGVHAPISPSSPGLGASSPDSHLESGEARPADSPARSQPTSPAGDTVPAPAASQVTVEPAVPPALSGPAAAGGQEAPPPSRQPYSPFRRTLYIQEQGSLLARQDERLLVKKDDEVLLEVPAAKVDQVFIFGRCAITTPAMTFCLEHRSPSC